MARSKFEERTMANLEHRGVSFDYESTRLEYTVVRNYLPDLILDSGIIVEIKGWFKPADRTKMLRVIEQHPDLDIRMLFQSDGKLYKGSKTTYTEWCDKHGIKCAVGRIPDEWTSSGIREAKKAKLRQRRRNTKRRV